MSKKVKADTTKVLSQSTLHSSNCSKTKNEETTSKDTTLPISKQGKKILKKHIPHPRSIDNTTTSYNSATVPTYKPPVDRSSLKTISFSSSTSRKLSKQEAESGSSKKSQDIALEIVDNDTDQNSIILSNEKVPLNYEATLAAEAHMAQFLRPISTLSSLTCSRSDQSIILRHMKVYDCPKESVNYIYVRPNGDLICARCENQLSSCTCIELLHEIQTNEIEDNSVDNLQTRDIEEQYATLEEIFEEEVQEEEEEEEQEEATKLQDKVKSYEQLQAELAKKQELVREVLEKSQRRRSKETQKQKSKIPKPARCKIPTDNSPQLKDEKSISELKNSSINTKKQLESKPLVKPNIYSMLRLAFEKNLNPNVRVQIENVLIDCHMIVLQSYSDFFVKCGNAQLVVLPTKFVSAPAFRMFYAWCLSGNPMVSVSTIVDIMKAAMYLRVSILVDICFQYLYDDLFSEDVAFHVYIKAHKEELFFVAHLMLTRIGRFFLPMVACQEFLDLNAKEMMELLDADLIGVHSESEVLFALVRWASHDWETRQRYMPSLVRKVRFGLMPVWYLYALTRGTDVPVLDRVLHTKGVKKFITDSIVFAMEREETNAARDELFKEIHLNEVPTFRERLWILDEKGRRNESYASLTYGEFLKYLNNLRTRDLSEFKNFSMGSSPKPRNCTPTPKQPKQQIMMFQNSTESEEFSDVQQQQERKFDMRNAEMRVRNTKREV